MAKLGEISELMKLLHIILDHPDYPDKIFIRLVSVALTIPDTSLQFCEDFTGSIYDTNNWILLSYGSSGYGPSGDMLVGDYGCPITGSDFEHYNTWQFRHKYLSLARTDIEVRGTMFVVDKNMVAD